MTNGEARGVRGAWEYGPTAQTVAANVSAARQRAGLTLRELSERMRTLSRPVTVDGLSKVEKCARRVDVDDLTALAVALETSPSKLLAPQGEPEDPASATGAPEGLTVQEVARWVTGEWGLGLGERLWAWRIELESAQSSLEANERWVAMVTERMQSASSPEVLERERRTHAARARDVDFHRGRIRRAQARIEELEAIAEEEHGGEATLMTYPGRDE